MVVVVVVVLVVGLFLAGRLSRFNIGTAVAPVQSADDCASATDAAIVARQEFCRVKRLIEGLRAQRDRDAQQLLYTQLVAAALLAAVVVANLVPILGPLLVQPIYAAYLAAQSYVIYLLGRLTGSAGNITAHEESLSTANLEERKAIAQLVVACGSAEAARQVSILPSC